ncbi:MAG: type II toxin-antitoxin system Phd/YefM family antitoxin [Chloroflexota bacterium]|nr:type II toxin-antitoxin system Phd/YefM family antitoxin [Chloroflexota bacterium]
MANRRVSTTAKAHLSELVGEVAYQGQHVIIERRGQPMAALVGMNELAVVCGFEMVVSNQG